MGKQLVLFTTLLLFASGGWSEINIQTVSENIYVFSEIDNQGLIVSGSNGTVVIDPISEHTAKSIQEFLSVNDKNAVSHVVYTHSHWDRISGGEVFQKNGVQFISQEACRLFFEGNKNEAVIEPNLYFKQSYKIALGNSNIELHYFGPSHGECMIVVHIEPENIFFVADLLSTNGPSFPNDPTLPYLRPATLMEFFAGVETIANQHNVNSFIGGQVENDTFGSIEYVAQQREFWKLVQATTEEAEEKGNVDINNFVDMDKIDLEAFKQFNNYNEEDLSNIFRRYTSFLNMGR